MGVRIIRISTKTLHHEWRGRLHAVKQVRVHNAGHLRLKYVLCALDLLVSKIAECRKVVTPHRLCYADCRVAETVANGNVCLLITGVQNLLGCDAMHNSVQVSCHQIDIETIYSKYRRRKTLISNRGRWSPLSLFRQVHLGVGKSENTLPSQGYELLQPGKQ